MRMALAALVVATPVAAQQVIFGEGLPPAPVIEEEGLPTTDQFGNVFSDVPRDQRRLIEEPDRSVVIQVDGAQVAPQGAVLRGLDRIRGRTEDMTIAPGETITYERLSVTLGECRYPPGEQTAEAFAYLIIQDLREGEAAFEGWMFASSPALSALDHPRYDVWVLNCKT